MRTPSIRYGLFVAVIGSTFLAPATSHGGALCDVLFTVGGATPLGALQWKTFYSEVSGDIPGSGGNAECRSTAPPEDPCCYAANDIDSSRILVQGRIALNGFLDTVSICTFRTGSPIFAEDFSIVVEEAVDPNLLSIVPLPEVTASVSSCEFFPAVCGDGLVDAFGGEECDVGPYVPGGCCSPSCMFEAVGTSCGEAPDVGDCRPPDSCDAAGVCRTTFEPAGEDAGCSLSSGEFVGNRFGAAVAATDDYLVVGAPSPQEDGAGTAHVFFRTDDGYQEFVQASPVVLPFQSGAGEKFGTSVDADQDTVIVGAPGDVVATEGETSFGSASVFVRTEGVWNLQQKLVDTTGQCGALGTDVAISGDSAVVGAPDGNCALVFHRTDGTWSLATTLTGGSDGARFGASVDISGDSLLVGAPGVAGDSGCQSAGTVYGYGRSGDTWVAEGSLPRDEVFGDVTVYADEFVPADACFGASVSVDGSTGIVGAPYDSGPGPDAGAAYVITRTGSTWNFTTQLRAFPTATEGERFGSSIDMKPDIAVIGSPGRAAYRFERSADAQVAGTSRGVEGPVGVWGRKGVYTSPDVSTPEDGTFGEAVAVLTRKAFLGAPAQAANPSGEAGVVYPTDAVVVPEVACGNSVVSPDEDCDDGDADWEAGELCNAACELVDCGDPNDSGSLTSVDALFTLRAAVNLEECDVKVCDVNGSGDATAVDALIVLKNAVGISQPLLCAAP